MGSKGKRRVAREMAVQMLYQKDVGESHLGQIFETFDPESYRQAQLEDLAAEEAGKAATRRDPGRERRRDEAAFQRAREIVRGTLENLEAIDELIRGQADNWRLERMPVVDRNVLRLAVYEMLFEDDTPRLVVVDEAIELAKTFGSEQSSRFINGLLDALLKQEAPVSET